MAEKVSQYKESLQKILQESYSVIIEANAVTYKNVFGAIAGYVDGNIFSSLGKFGFALKLPKPELTELLKVGCKPLKYFPKGNIKKDYVIISNSILENKAKIQLLIKKSVKFATG